MSPSHPAERSVHRAALRGCSRPDFGPESHGNGRVSLRSPRRSPLLLVRLCYHPRRISTEVLDEPSWEGS